MTHRLAMSTFVLFGGLYSSALLGVNDSRYTAVLSGDAQVPSSTSTSTATCELTRTARDARMMLRCEHTVLDATVTRIHSGLPGERGPELLSLETGPGPVAGDWGPTSDQLRELEAGALYVTIASIEHAEGEIRGQLAPEGARRWPERGNPATKTVHESPGCAMDSESLCLANNRFRVTVQRVTGGHGDAVRADPGQAVTDSPASGRFWFERGAAPELSVALLDSCSKTGHFGVRITPAAKLDFDLTIKDTDTGGKAHYRSSPDASGRPIVDETLFACAK